MPIAMITGGKPQDVLALLQALMERFGADARLMDIRAALLGQGKEAA